MSDTFATDFATALRQFKTEWEAGRQPVTIPRAQYEALMAAVEGLKQITRFAYGHEARTLANAKLAALEAALSGEKDADSR